MRKTIFLATGLAVAAIAANPASAEVRAYWDQASGKWLKYDTDLRRVLPKSYSPIVRTTINYDGPFHPNTIVINTAERRLYYVLPGGKALKYGVGVGREGFQWSGADRISRKAEWPDWTPPPEMIKREKARGRILPEHMPGGPKNPLGARALYIGGTLYRIHGSNEPWTIGHAVSSGCIRLTNDDITDLYDKVKVGTRVVVLTGKELKAQLYALANPPPPPPKEEEAPVVAEDEEQLTKDDQVVVLAPTDGAVETTGSVTDGVRVKDDDVLVSAPAMEPVADEPDPAAARVKDDDVVAPAQGDVTVIVDDEPAVAAN